jgi:hypothetical protein
MYSLDEAKEVIRTLKTVEPIEYATNQYSWVCDLMTNFNEGVVFHPYGVHDDTLNPAEHSHSIAAVSKWALIKYRNPNNVCRFLMVNSSDMVQYFHNIVQNQYIKKLEDLGITTFADTHVRTSIDDLVEKLRDLDYSKVQSRFTHILIACRTEYEYDKVRRFDLDLLKIAERVDIVMLNPAPKYMARWDMSIKMPEKFIISGANIV